MKKLVLISNIIMIGLVIVLLSIPSCDKEAQGAQVSAVKAPKGFVALFNGKDLTGWKGLVGNPKIRAKMKPQELLEAQVKADEQMRANWKVVEGVLEFDGQGSHLCTIKDYENFEVLVDWKIESKGDSGLYLRGSPQVQIWDPAQWPVGSGGLYNNQKNPKDPLVCADNPIGTWNTFRIIMIGEIVTVYLNNKLVVDHVVMENYWERKKPIYPSGQIELQSHGSKLQFRNIFIRELPAGTPLFNGKDLGGWEIMSNAQDSWKAEGGVLKCTGKGGGWISTAKEYDNFELSLEYKVPPGGNSGVFVRCPRQGDGAYAGMEIQVLDDYAEGYAQLKPWQYTGSIYDVVAAQPRVTKPAGEWQTMVILCDEQRVKVTINDTVVVDANLADHMARADKHPGLKREGGYIGFQNHGAAVEYRNVILREIEKDTKGEDSKEKLEKVGKKLRKIES
jgi:hypothetical protein